MSKETEKFWCLVTAKLDQSYKHPSLEAAKEAAAREARFQGEGVKVYVLEKVAECEVTETPIAWK